MQTRTTTAQKFHPKTQEHRSSKFQSFHYSGKYIGNGVSGLSGPIQPHYLESVFSKTVGTSISSGVGGSYNPNGSLIPHGNLAVSNLQRNSNAVPVVYKVAASSWQSTRGNNKQ